MLIYHDTWQQVDRLLESLRHEGHHVAAYCRYCAIALGLANCDLGPASRRPRRSPKVVADGG